MRRLRPRPPRFLFVCVENAGRSQMAEGFALALGLDAFSCGSAPARRVNPLAIEAMREKGIDISGHAPRGFADVPEADIVVTMGCGDACPYVPIRRIDWAVPDPKGKGIEEVRDIRDDIELLVHDLVDELL
ncbi:MAG: arsenate reductase ArsC [Thermoanaerobaculia bacterium]